MIYLKNIDDFPEIEECIEILSYMDENDFEWKIARTNDGFYVGYFGDGYFKETYFQLKINGKHKLLINTGCFFVDGKDFDSFYNFREILSKGWTDDIWATIEDLINQRLRIEPELKADEVIKK